MSNRHDPVQVLRHLARTLDVKETIEAFPGLSREEFADILNTVTGPDQRFIISCCTVGGWCGQGKPGASRAQVLSLRSDDGSVHRFGEYLGTATNNVAEYKALLAGVQKAARAGYPRTSGPV